MRWTAIRTQIRGKQRDISNMQFPDDSEGRRLLEPEYSMKPLPLQRLVHRMIESYVHGEGREAGFQVQIGEPSL
jgi:hypothetical protein